MSDFRLPRLRGREFIVLCACFALAACGSPASAPVPSPHVVGPSGLVVSPGALSMSPGDHATVNANERGYGGSYSQTNTCAGIASVNDGSPGSFGVTAVAPGLCTITVSDSSGHNASVNVSVQSVVIGGQ